MSLVVWLPLNGNLNNQGLSDVTVTVSGTTTFTAGGKLGAGLSCNGSSYWNISSVTLTNNTSICVWVKTTDDNAMLFVLDANGYTANYFNFWIKSGKYYLNTGDSYQNPFQNNGTDITAPSDGAFHNYILTFDGTQCLLYVDGNYVGKAKTYRSPVATNKIIKIAGGFGNAHSYDLAGTINDFRVYDHTLSEKEIKEISKGLVLHYKLDDQHLESTTNLCSNSMTGWNNSGTCVRNTNDTSIPNPPTAGNVYSVTATSDGSMAVTCGVTSTSLPSKTIIVSVYCWLDGTQDNSTVYVRSTKTDGNVGSLYYNGTTGPSTWPSRQWIRLISNPITTSSDATTFYICTYVNKNTEVRAFNGWQIEEKDHVTPWTAPGTTRTESTLYDYSGYCNDASIHGNLSIVSSDARYKNCIAFTNSSYLRTIDKVSTFLPTDALTVNLWIKYSTWGNPISCTESGGWNIEANSTGIRFPVYVASVGYKAAQTNITAASLVNTGWHMITGTFDRTNVKIYIDAELKNTTATGSTNNIAYANNYLFIAAEAQGDTVTPSNSAFVGSISDVRIYATALTADDILELYHTAASIDNNGNLYSYSFEET